MSVLLKETVGKHDKSQCLGTSFDIFFDLSFIEPNLRNSRGNFAELLLRNCGTTVAQNTGGC